MRKGRKKKGQLEFAALVNLGTERDQKGAPVSAPSIHVGAHVGAAPSIQVGAQVGADPPQLRYTTAFNCFLIAHRCPCKSTTTALYNRVQLFPYSS